MTKRLQVLVDDSELREIQRAARRHRQSVAEWVRGALRTVRLAEAGRPTADKLQALHRATAHSFPTGSIDEMLADIERGYSGTP